jgi:hypothetical protein
MTRARPPGEAFAARPTDPDAWVRRAAGPAGAPSPYTARLTIDVTPKMRGRIKVAAFERGRTVADMLRALFEDQYGDGSGS